MQTHTNTSIHMYTCSCTFTYIWTLTQTYIHAYAHSCTYIYTHLQIRTYMCIHSYIHTKYTYMHIDTYICTHAHTHMYLKIRVFLDNFFCCFFLVLWFKNSFTMSFPTLFIISETRPCIPIFSITSFMFINFMYLCWIFSAKILLWQEDFFFPLEVWKTTLTGITLLVF